MPDTILDGKKLVGPQSSDKVLYYYKLIAHEPLNKPCHILGTQAASSGTNTATLGTTPTKQFNVKDTGSINQQRIVNVVMTTGDGFKTDVAKDLYYTWEHHEEIALYRVDWNSLRTENGKQVVNAEMSIAFISSDPETEALNTAVTQNVTFEVTGIARRYDEDGNPFTLSAEDFDDGLFSATLKYYNFAKPSEIGNDNGTVVNNAPDDSHAGDKNGTKPFGGDSTTSTTTSPSGTNTPAAGAGA